MIHLCLCLFGIFILTQVSFVCRSNSLSYLWQADQLLKHKAALSCIQSCSINRGLCGRAFTCTRLPQNAIWRGWGRAPSLFFMAVTNALSLPYHTNKNNFGLICWTRVFLRTSAPPILLIVHILMFKTLWSCSILDTASASRSLNYENEEKQHCFHQTAMLFSFYQFVLFPGFQMYKKKKSCWVLTTRGPGSQLVRKGFAVTAFKVKHI